MWKVEVTRKYFAVVSTSNWYNMPFHTLCTIALDITIPLPPGYFEKRMELNTIMSKGHLISTEINILTNQHQHILLWSSSANWITWAKDITYFCRKNDHFYSSKAIVFCFFCFFFVCCIFLTFRNYKKDLWSKLMQFRDHVLLSKINNIKMEQRFGVKNLLNSSNRNSVLLEVWIFAVQVILYYFFSPISTF